MKLSRLINIAGVGLVVFGVALLAYSFQVRGTNAAIQAQPAFTMQNSVAPAVSDPEALRGTPVRLLIPEIGIDNQIIPGVFDSQTGQWTLTLDKVQHAVMTYEPNNAEGLTFLYGHNRRAVFAKLPSIKEGALAEIKTDNGLTFRYKFTGSVTTNPEDIALFDYSGQPMLVLQTCTGLFYQNRELFSFELVEVSHD